MEQAISKARQLSEEEQDALASIILREIESEQRWGQLFAQDKSADLLSQMADEALAEAGVGRAQRLDTNEL
jgi:hypothetical protein